MQRAARSVTTRRPAASFGKSNENSVQHVVLLDDVQRTGLLAQTDKGHEHIDAALLLIRVAREVCEEAGDAQGFWVRGERYHEERLNQVSALLDMIWQRVDWINETIDRQHEIVSAGYQR